MEGGEVHDVINKTKQNPLPKKIEVFHQRHGRWTLLHPIQGNLLQHSVQHSYNGFEFHNLS